MAPRQLVDQYKGEGTSNIAAAVIGSQRRRAAPRRPSLLDYYTCHPICGDYYDYLYLGEHQPGKIGVVVGDVSGHGISAALLMASARSSLRQRALLSGNMAQIVSDVNRRLALDVEDSGRFMTLFCSEIDIRRQRIRWVRAGHFLGSGIQLL